MKRLLALAALLLGLSIALWMDGPPGETEMAYHDLLKGEGR